LLGMQADHWKPSSYFESGEWAHVSKDPVDSRPEWYKIAVEFGRIVPAGARL
jgi:hypothetical protein